VVWRSVAVEVGGLGSWSFSFFFLPNIKAFLTPSLFLSTNDLKEDFSIPETSMTGT
jgi:hypothetical protein